MFIFIIQESQTDVSPIPIRIQKRRMKDIESNHTSWVPYNTTAANRWSGEYWV